MGLVWISVALAGGLGLGSSQKPEEPTPTPVPEEAPPPTIGGLLGSKPVKVEAVAEVKPPEAPKPPERLLGVPREAAEAIWKLELSRANASMFALYIDDSDPAVRAFAARAVGRLRQGVETTPSGTQLPPTDALKLLEKALGDTEAGVRVAAAEGLGLTAGGGKALAARLLVESELEVQQKLVWALGRQGGTDAVGLVLERVGRVPGGDAVAVEALGRMGMRKVEGIGDLRVISALTGLLAVPVGPARELAGWAISRIGVSEKLPETVRNGVRAAALQDPSPVVRAWLVRAALGPSVGRLEFLKEVARDSDKGVRVAAARGIGKYGCGEDGAVLSSLVEDKELTVRLEALAAVGECKIAADPLKKRLSEGAAPVVERAALVKALAALGGLPELNTWMVPSQPLLVRVAAIESSKDRGELLKIALTGDHPMIRTAAAGVLLEGPTTAELVALLGAADEVLVEAAADALREKPDVKAEVDLVGVLKRDKVGVATVGSCFRALSALYISGKVKTPLPGAKEQLVRWLGTNPELRKDVEQIAGLLQLKLPDAPSVTPPSLAEVLTIRSARLMTSAGEIRVALDPELAPYTVWNFAELAEKGAYQNISFHRVVPEFVVQTGDPRGDGWGGPGYVIPDEVSDAPYTTGTLGMALSGPDTGGSQWFITLTPQPHLTGDYTVFGEVVVGLRTAAALVQGDTLVGVTIERVPIEVVNRLHPS